MLQLLPALEELAGRLGALGSSAMSWEQVEEMLMLPLQPRATSAESASRRWVRQVGLHRVCLLASFCHQLQDKPWQCQCQA